MTNETGTAKLAALIARLGELEELTRKVIAEIEGETEDVFNRVRKRLKEARYYVRDGKLIARYAAEALGDEEG